MVYGLASLQPSIELEGDLQPLNTVGLVVEYAPATGETRVRFPDGVALPTKDTSTLFECLGPRQGFQDFYPDGWRAETFQLSAPRPSCCSKSGQGAFQFHQPNSRATGMSQCGSHWQ